MGPFIHLPKGVWEASPLACGLLLLKPVWGFLHMGGEDQAWAPSSVPRGLGYLSGMGAGKVQGLKAQFPIQLSVVCP